MPNRHEADVIPLPVTAHPAELGGRSDDELVALAAAGLVPAFTEIVRRHGERVRRYCGKWTGSAAAGDDLAQEVFLDLWRIRGSYRGEGRFLPFLFTMVRNRCRSARRALVRPAPALETGHDLAPPQLEALLATERRRRTDEAVAELPVKLREALLLRFGAGLEYPEMATLLGCPEATVRSRIFLAVARLRRALAQEAP